MIISADSIRRKLYQRSFFHFFKAFWDVIVAEKLVLNWHIEYLCHEIQKVAELVFNEKPKAYDLVINISPGSSKSTIISQALPAWCWTNMPHFRSINGSYAYDLALRDAVACRDIVESELYSKLWPNLQLREDRNTMGLFLNHHKGGRLSVSVGSKVTGFHGHILGIDDPLDPQGAISEAKMKEVNWWMTNTLPSRGIMKSDTPMILVQQRLAQADPSGERIAKGGRLRHICIPAELLYSKEGQLDVNVQPPGLIKFYKDRLMDPNRLTRRHLEEFRKQLGEYGYAGQYLQDPVPLSGAMFDTTKLKYENAVPRFTRLVRAWDKAATKDGGAYSAGVLMGVDKQGEYWILHVVRGQWTPTTREKVIQQTAAEDAKGMYARLIGIYAGPVHVEIVIEQEPGSGGIESTENTIRRLQGYHAIGKKPATDKSVRAYNFASQVGIQDQVHVVLADWTKAFVEEMRFFPNSKYKDQIDAASLAFNRLAKPIKVVGAIRLETVPR